METRIEDETTDRLGADAARGGDPRRSCCCSWSAACADRLEPGYGTAAAVTLGARDDPDGLRGRSTSRTRSQPPSAFARLRAAPARARRAGPARAGRARRAAAPGSRSRSRSRSALAGAVLFFYAIAREGLAAARAARLRASGAIAGRPARADLQLVGARQPVQARLRRRGRRDRRQRSSSRSGSTATASSASPLPRFNAAVDLLVGSTRPARAHADRSSWASSASSSLPRAATAPRVGPRWRWSPRTSSTTPRYWQPFGGGTPGPRFLVPILPYLALGFACRLPPPAGDHCGARDPVGAVDARRDAHLPADRRAGHRPLGHQLGDGVLEHTLLTVLGVHPNWLAAAAADRRRRSRRGGSRARRPRAHAR